MAVPPVPIVLPLTVRGTVPIDIVAVMLLPINAPRTVFMFIEVVVVLVLLIVSVVAVVVIVTTAVMIPILSKEVR
jgi:hypothetical protein